MADDALDAGSLQRDRQRYQGFLAQAEGQLAACQQRIEHLQQAVDALDRLVALAEGGGAPAGGRARPATAAKPGPAPAGRAPSPTATPAAPEPVEPPATTAGTPDAAGAPKGTDALRQIFESDPGRTWSLAEVLDALGARGWLPGSRRPEEGVRISLKRLVDKGGAERVDEGRWRGTATDAADVDPTAPPAESEPPRSPEPERPAPRTSYPQYARPSSFGRPVGGTVTEL